MLVGLTWYAYVIQTHDASWAELIPFHILLFLLITSYLQSLPTPHPRTPRLQATLESN